MNKSYILLGQLVCYVSVVQYLDVVLRRRVFICAVEENFNM